MIKITEKHCAISGLYYLRHYDKHHKEIFTGNPDMVQCFFVIFIVKPEFENVNFYQAKWFCTLSAKININKMILLFNIALLV